MKKNLEHVVVQGNRRYKGNPLAYLKRHEKKYRKYIKKGRYGFSLYDPGLYKALIRAGQIDDAIPEKYGGRHSLPEKKINNLVAAYETHNGKAYRAARKFHCSCSTVMKYWKLNNKKARKVGRPRKN